MPPVETSCPAPPSQNPHKAIEDQQAAFAEMTSRTTVNEAFRSAFLHSKLRIAHTHPALDIAARDLAVRDLSRRLGPTAREMIARPIPGGVGYGVFYNPPFKTAWGNGTAVICNFVCPTPPGGNVNTFLYLTATNRAGLGVEALVVYNGQSAPHFAVFDWARSDHWQTDVSFASLGNYVGPLSAHGHPYQVLPVWNSTSLIGRGRYRNQVFLYNHTRGDWDLIYQYDYAATDAQQKTGWVGSWGPLVETFQPLYTQTNQMGALAVELVSANSTGQWGSWALLASPNSYVRVDNVGFRLTFLDPNSAFTVNS